MSKPHVSDGDSSPTSNMVWANSVPIRAQEAQPALSTAQGQVCAAHAEVARGVLLENRQRPKFDRLACEHARAVTSD